MDGADTVPFFKGFTITTKQGTLNWNGGTRNDTYTLKNGAMIAIICGYGYNHDFTPGSFGISAKLDGISLPMQTIKADEKGGFYIVPLTKVSKGQTLVITTTDGMPNVTYLYSVTAVIN